MTWVLQAAVVLAVPLSLLGATWVGVRTYRVARANRGASARTGVGIYTSDGELELGGFRGWLADLVDGKGSDGGSSGWSGAAADDASGDDE